jgi:hypothetical protein
MRLAAWISIINQNSKMFLWRFTGNRRASAVRGKDLLEEFARCENNARSLKGYARWIDCVLTLEGYAPPIGPTLMTRDTFDRYE